MATKKSKLDKSEILEAQDSLPDQLVEWNDEVVTSVVEVAVQPEPVAPAPEKVAEVVVPKKVEYGDLNVTGPTSDKIGQIVSQKKGKVSKYYKRLSSRH